MQRFHVAVEIESSRTFNEEQIGSILEHPTLREALLEATDADKVSLRLLSPGPEHVVAGEDCSGSRIPEPGRGRQRTCKLVVEVTYQPAKTSPDSLAAALDTLLANALSSPGILDDHGDPEIGEFQPEG